MESRDSSPERPRVVAAAHACVQHEAVPETPCSRGGRSLSWFGKSSSADDALCASNIPRQGVAMTNRGDRLCVWSNRGRLIGQVRRMNAHRVAKIGSLSTFYSFGSSNFILRSDSRSSTAMQVLPSFGVEKTEVLRGTIL